MIYPNPSPAELDQPSIVHISAPTPPHTPPLPYQFEALKSSGIAYTCTCPRFNHYHTCKHSIMIGIRTSQVRCMYLYRV